MPRAKPQLCAFSITELIHPLMVFELLILIEERQFADVTVSHAETCECKDVIDCFIIRSLSKVHSDREFLLSNSSAVDQEIHLYDCLLQGLLD